MGKWRCIDTKVMLWYNDYLDLYYKRDGDNVIISDDAYISRKIAFSDIDFAKTMKKYNVKMVDNELIVEGSWDDFDNLKENLIRFIKKFI